MNNYLFSLAAFLFLATTSAIAQNAAPFKGLGAALGTLGISFRLTEKGWKDR